MPKVCWNCGGEWPDRRSPGFREECPACAEPAHCCRNCRFYEEKAQQWCREPLARDERPGDPAQANLCECFLFREGSDSGVEGDERGKRRAALEASIFGGAAAAAETASAETEKDSSLDDLFRLRP